jgi:ABC-type antimicrobial peptide transport system permease subunit
MRQGVTLSAGGVALGIVGGSAVTKYLQSMLFGVSALDPATFAAASVLFTAVAIAASYLPARQATRVDPIKALRSE